jgi:hypothetical protein|tara:strand:+ start:983 stop:1285 length:303 start_codon:yes stop_codon:yes gene_type:complete
MENQLDSIVSSVIEKFEKRAIFGKNKYGTDLDRKDLNFLEWSNHYQEELMDAILYLEKMKKTYLEIISKQKETNSKEENNDSVENTNIKIMDILKDNLIL